jgi:hypothetical protein
MITLFHGSFISIEHPLVSVGRKKLDFGPGFYLTKLQSQAEAWAKVIAERQGPLSKPILNKYDYDSIAQSGYRHKIFEEYNLEWLDYVIDCRHGGSLHKKYDIVEGGVANDNVIDTVEDYEKGIITAEQALGQLRYKKVNHQLCILNQEIIGNNLRYLGCVYLTIDEED